MPRYRIIRPIPEAIGFRNGTLHFCDYYAGGKEWVWYVRREASGSAQIKSAAVNLLVAEGADKLEQMRAEGFSAADGSVAAGVLDSLVRGGYAERLPAR